MPPPAVWPAANAGAGKPYPSNRKCLANSELDFEEEPLPETELDLSLGKTEERLSGAFPPGALAIGSTARTQTVAARERQLTLATATPSLSLPAPTRATVVAIVQFRIGKCQIPASRDRHCK
ncbi:MAG: hypothetical protein AAGI45_23625 [Cyanobacteria bacterium P01_H01_bin.26]